jgi:beta-carotene 3-hydroxylase
MPSSSPPFPSRCSGGAKLVAGDLAGAGMTLHGLLYFIAHDGLVPKRWPFTHIPCKGCLKRLYQAHRLHHAVDGKDGCVSFGFIYAPPVTKLVKELDRNGKAQLSGAEIKPVAADGDGATPR